MASLPALRVASLPASCRDIRRKSLAMDAGVLLVLGVRAAGRRCSSLRYLNLDW